MICLFVDEADAEIAGFKASQDVDALENRLHFLKGSALNLGFSDLARICQKAESAAAWGATDDIDIGAIISCYESSKS